MSNKYQRDEEYLERIRTGDESLVRQLFLEFRAPFLGYFLKQYQLSREIVFDIYLKSFTTFYEKARNGELKAPLTSTLQVYVIGIGKNGVKQHWDDENRNKLKLIGDDEIKQAQHFLEPEVNDRHQDEANRNLVEKLLSQLSQKCRDLLTLKYLEGYAYDAVANTLNIANENAARQQTFQCIKKLRGLMNAEGS